MNRRKAIRNILLVIGATAVAVPAYKWYAISRKVNPADLAGYSDLLSELAETIIPATDTPGAKDAGVGDFICKMLLECTDVKTQNKFLHGLHHLEDYCRSKHGKSFIKCSVPEREDVLNYFEKDDRPRSGIIGKVQRKFLGTSFFTTLKNYTVMGYCTSMQGATKGLAYDYIPVNYEAVLPLRPGQRSWATK